jgi:predicted nucleotidyltransferase
LATLRLRDRDAIITKEGLIFRVFGYAHPSNAYVCDVEYAPAEIFKSENPKAFRITGKHVFCKFYEDEGWKFVKNNFPQHMIYLPTLRKKVVGVEHSDIVEVRKPNEKLRKLVEKKPKDELSTALQSALKIVTETSGLSTKNFGVFGSLLHGFYHPRFSDIDLIVYSRKNLTKLRETLQELYQDRKFLFRNEFERDNVIKGKNWRFQNYSSKEFVWHQRRKLIYAVFNDEKSGRIIKTEFEPVKDWKEIQDMHFSEMKIVQKGWVKMFAYITEDYDTPFIPSVYSIEPSKILDGKTGAKEAKRLISYMEEFRMQTQKDEKVYIEGNLEEVVTPKDSFYQITLTYCPRYYEQVLKVVP